MNSLEPMVYWLGKVMEERRITKGYVPGAIGRVAELHGRYYGHHWGFGLFFEAKVATELSEFMGRCQEDRDGFWIARENDRIIGSITIDGAGAGKEGAHLRWFIVSEAFQGQGIGTLLVNEALVFCRDTGYDRIYLWTFEGLDAARHLYEKKGFRLVEQRIGSQWGKETTEQRFELHFDGH